MVDLTILGIGNPGLEYQDTRHNVGFCLVDTLAKKWGITLNPKKFGSYLAGVGVVNQKSILLVKPQTYVNRSGSVMPSIRKKWGVKPDKLIVAVDNLDLKVGVCRLKKGGGSAGHNGLKSLITSLATPEFLRLYIGIDRPLERFNVSHWVLETPKEEELPFYEQAYKQAVLAVESLIEGLSLERVMEQTNRKVKKQ